MKKLYDIPRREHQVDQIRRYASLGRRFVSLQNSVRAIDGTSKNPISTVVTCQKFGTASGEEMAQFFADFLQRVADDMVDPPVAASTADVSPDRDILAEMYSGPIVHVGYDFGDKETSVEAMHFADGRILVTNVKVIDHSADTDQESVDEKPRYLLVKRGLYERPDHIGYTGVKWEAGRYLESDAAPDCGVTAIHEDAAPLFAPACWEETKAKHYEATIATLTARNAELVEENERLTIERDNLLRQKAERLVRRALESKP